MPDLLLTPAELRTLAACVDTTRAAAESVLRLGDEFDFDAHGWHADHRNDNTLTDLADKCRTLAAEGGIHATL